jgi:hypothetical protein
VASSQAPTTVARAAALAGAGRRESHGQPEKRPNFQSHEHSYQQKEPAGLMVAEFSIEPTASYRTRRQSSTPFQPTNIRENQP